MIVETQTLLEPAASTITRSLNSFVYQDYWFKVKLH